MLYGEKNRLPLAAQLRVQVEGELIVVFGDDGYVGFHGGVRFIGGRSARQCGEAQKGNKYAIHGRPPEKICQRGRTKPARRYSDD